MIRCREAQFRVGDVEAAPVKLAEGHFPDQVVKQMAVDVQEVPPVAEVAHDVPLPNLLQHGQRHQRPPSERAPPRISSHRCEPSRR